MLSIHCQQFWQLKELQARLLVWNADLAINTSSLGATLRGMRLPTTNQINCQNCTPFEHTPFYFFFFWCLSITSSRPPGFPLPPSVPFLSRGLSLTLHPCASVRVEHFTLLLTKLPCSTKHFCILLPNREPAKHPNVSANNYSNADHI